MALTKSTYAPPGTGHHHQDAAINPATLADGTLLQRFDRVAYPQLGVKNLGTDGNGHDVPAPARLWAGETKEEG
jgi:hypothetical protein